MPISVKTGGVWQTVTQPSVKVAGVWQPATKVSTKVDGNWIEVWPGAGAIPPGTYVLGATALSLPNDGNGLAEFDTTAYRGSIVEIRCRVSWRLVLADTTTQNSVAGRPNGNFYRNIQKLAAYSHSTIDHRIDTFDATSLTDFNNGAAIGFTFGDQGYSLGLNWSNVQLVLTTA